MRAGDDHPAWDFLEREHHQPIMDDLEHLAERAGLPPSDWPLVWTPLDREVYAQEVRWVERYPEVKGIKAGVVYLGTGWDPTVRRRVHALTACFLRNFVDARVVYLRDLTAALAERQDPEGTMVLVPDFFDPADRSLPGWLVEEVAGWLTARVGRGKQTVVGVTTLSGMTRAWGRKVPDLLRDEFLVLEAGNGR